jgi:hypothetical protein
MVVDSCPGCGQDDLGECRNIGTSAYFHSLDFPWQTCLLLLSKNLLLFPWVISR